MMMSNKCALNMLRIFMGFFSVLHVHAQNVEIRTPVGNLTIEYCQVFKKTIPKTAYFDKAANTNDLEIKLLDQYRLEVASSAEFLQLNPQDRTIYIISESKTIATETRKYFLRALNPNTGDYIDDCFYVNLQGNIPLPNFQIKFKANVLIPSPSKTETLYRFIEKIYSQSNRDISSGNDVFVNDSVLVQSSANQFLEFTYQNCTIREQPCDFEATRDMRLLFGLFDKKDVEANRRRNEFLQLVQPEFNITEMTHKFIGACVGISDSGPAINAMAVLSWFTGALIVPPYPGMFSQDIPKNTFTSEVQSDEIRIELMQFIGRSSNYIPTISTILIQKSYWACIWRDLNDLAFPYKLDIVFTDDAYSETMYEYRNKQLYLSFMVRGIDQLNRQAQTDINFDRGTTPTSYYVITFQFSSFNRALVQTTDIEIMVLQMKKFLLKLFSVFATFPGIDYSVLINLKKFVFTSTVNMLASGTAIWAINVGSECDSSLIQSTQTIMFSSVKNKIINPTFKSGFSDLFVLESITEEFNGPCTLDPPEKVNSIPALDVSFCGLLIYVIPENTFNDKQDGNTRKLTLSLTDESNQALSTNSWLQFDQTAQTIYALLPSNLPTSTRQYKFVLTATDTTDLKTTCDITVNIVGSAQTSSYTVTLRGKYTPTNILNPAHFIARQVGNFFNDNSSGFQLLSYAELSTGDPYIEFTNCTWRQTPCDAIKVNTYKTSIFGNDDLADIAFTDIFKPEFTNVVVTGQRKGACENNNPPTNPNPWGPLSINTCDTFQKLVPENTFNDIEQGVTRNLRLTCNILNADSTTSELPYWVTFDTTKQELIVLASHQLQQTVHNFQLTAFDIEGLNIAQNLQLNLVKQTGTPSHLITMKISVTSTEITNYVTLYNNLRERIQFYFGDTVPTVSYLQVSNYPSAQYDVIWTNCTLSRTVCEQEKIDYIQNIMVDTVGNVDQSFSNSLSSQFVIQSFEFKENGICVEIKKPPVVKNDIPTQEITYCEYLKYTIPEKTFEDIIDGNTRQLKLSLTFQDGTTLPYDYWLSFNNVEQSITAVLQSVNAPEKTEHIFHLTATNSRSLSNTTFLKIQILGTKQPQRISFKMNTFVSYTALSASEVFAKFLDKSAEVFPGEVGNIHIYDGAYFADAAFLQVSLINCNCTDEFIQSHQHTHHKFDFTKFGPEFSSLTLDVRDGEPCGELPCPTTLVPPRPFEVQRCQYFKHGISGEVFKDHYGSEALVLSITSVNGKQTPSWMAINGHSIEGIVTHDAIINRPESGKYNITLRATNQIECYVETWLEMTVGGSIPQTFYQYDLTVTDNNVITSTPFSQELSRQIDIGSKINTYFSFAIFDITVYTAMSNNQFALKWSVCNLPNKCTEEGFSIHEGLIFSSKNIVKDSFTAIFPTEYTLISITEDISDSCKIIDPPSPKVDPLQIVLDYCGGLVYTIAEDLFMDTQDGHTRNLKLYFEVTRGTPASQNYDWIDFNQQTQTLYVMPTYDQARSFLLNFQVFFLTAEDSSGQTSTIQVFFTMNLPAGPKHWYMFIMSSFNQNSISDRFLFMDKLASFKGDPNRASIGFKTISSNRIDYFNCSIPLNPCDLYQFEQIKLSLSSANDVPKTALVDAMKPEFTIVSVSSQWVSPCGGPTVPKVNDTPAVKVINICGYTTYIIPEYTFYDCESGPTKNLQLSLTVSSGASFSMNNYVQFYASTQSLTIIPRAELFAMYGTSFEFSLTATDNTQLSASTSLNIKVTGPYNLLRECQIQVTVQITTSTIRTNIEAMTFIMNKLAMYFGVSVEEIGIVDFYSTGTNNFYFAWSYCSAIYTQESHSSNSDLLQADYKNFQKLILMKLFLYDRKTVNPNFYTVFDSEYLVTNVKTAFTKRCEDLPPITIVDPITITIGYGGYIIHNYQDNYFYDFEDGWAYSLTISFYNSMFTEVLIDHWVNVDVTTRNIIAVITDYIRFHISSSFIYYLQATDSIGQYTRLQVNIIKSTEILTFAPFNITYLLQYNGQVGLIYSNQSSYIINQITTYWSSVTTVGHVLVRWYYQSSGFTQYRVITWSIHAHTCQSQVLADIKTAYANNNGELHTNLVNSLNDMFTLKRIYYHSSCDVCIIDPPEIPLPSIQVKYCSIYSYQIPITLFNGECGNTYTMQLALLTGNGIMISNSSWIQLNSATLEIYAVAIESMMQSTTNQMYQLQATTSSGQSSSSSFTASIIDEPYTADCKMTMSFKYKFMTSTIVHLDIIRHFIQEISSYYKDTTIKVKVLNFYARSENVFEIIWSNCSFIYQSAHTASAGLTENDRTAIEQIFSQIVVTSSGTILSSFQQYMSSYFEIQTISVNYDCIEEPPVPSGEHIVYAKFCELFNDSIPRTTFHDKRDGDTRNLKLKLAFPNGNIVPIDHWLQIDSKQNLYGIVTEQIKEAAGFDGFRYVIIATDSAGLSANISYTIKITSPKQFFDVYFRTGFTNKFDYLENTAIMVYRIVERLSKYLDPTDKVGRIYVKEFNYPSAMVWAPCSLQPCSIILLQNIINMLTSSNGIIRPEFQQALGPEIIPLTTRLNIIKPEKCSSSNITIIIVDPPPTPIVPNCGYWTYQIRSDQFRDISQRQTSLFYLNLFYQNGGLIPSTSWIRFNQTQQFIYGISILSQVTATSSYKLEARHQSSGMTSSITTTVTVKDYQEVTKVSSKLCQITFNITVSYNQAFDDVTILKFFMETLSKYLQQNMNEIQIVNYFRYPGYPYHFIVTWTNCTLTSIFIQNNYATEYYTSFTQILNKMLQYENSIYTTINPEIQQYFTTSSLFVINWIKTNDNCTEPPKKPPVGAKDVKFAITCGVFAHQISEDTFTSGTSQLSLTLKNTDGSSIASDSWIVLNRTGYLVGMLKDNSTYFSAVNGEYRYILEGKDSQGLIGETNVIVAMPQKPLPITPYKLFFGFKSTNQYPSSILLEYDVANRLNNEFLTLTLTQFNLFFIGPLIETLPGTYLSYLSPCESCYTEINKNIEMAFLFQDLISEKLSPDFTGITLFPEYAADSCSIVFNPSAVANETIYYCSYWLFNLTKLEGTEVTSSFTIDFRTPDGEPLPIDSWITYNDYALEAFPPESFWAAPTSQIYEFQYTLVRKSDGTKTAFTKKLSLSLEKDPNIPKETIIFSIRLASASPRDPDKYNNYYISLVMKALVNLVGSGVGIHFLSYTEIQTNPFIFEVKWQNCTLPTSCNNTEIKQVNLIIFGKNSLGIYLINQYIPGEYVINDYENKCSKQPPTAPTALNLSVPVCGVFKHELNEVFVTNAEGATLKDFTVTLLQANGNDLSIDSWIRYNETSKEIYALPNEAVSTVTTAYVYKLKFTDKDGVSTETTVYVSIIDNKETFYGMSITFNSLMSASTPHLELQVKMLELISLYIEGKANIERYRTLIFEQTQTQYYFRFGNCSIDKNLCENQLNQIVNIESKLFTINNKLTTNFQNFIKQYFTGINMKRESGSLNIDTPPVTSSTIQTISLDKCQTICVDYMNSFYDNEQSKESLNYVLKTESSEIVPRSHWVQLDGNQVCVYPWLNITTGTYKYNLVATDNCGNSVTNVLTVIINSVYKAEFGYKWNITSEMIRNVSINDVHYLRLIREQMIKYLKMKLGNRYTENQLQILDYAFKNNILELSFGECSIVYKPCNQSAVSLLKATIFNENNQPDPQLLQMFNDVIESQSIQIKGQRQFPCGGTPEGPNCNPTKLTYNASICSVFTMKIPDVCNDNEDGGIGDLQLKLFTTAYTEIPIDSWIQFNTSSQSIYGYPLYQTKDIQITGEYRYILEVKDKDGNAAIIDVCVNLNGPVPTLDYQVTLEGRLSTPQQSIPYVDNQICMIQQLKSYFNEGGITNINYQIPQDATNDIIQYKFGFCEMRIQPCDCMMVKKTKLLFENFQNFQNKIKSCININTVNYMLYGECSNTNAPTLENGITEIEINVGEYHETKLPYNQFIDLEDGGNENLTIILRDSNNNDITIDSLQWMTIYKNQICGVLDYYIYKRNGLSVEKVYTYYITAIDSCGKEKKDEYKVKIINNYPGLMYTIQIWFSMPFDDLIGNCSKLEDLIEKIADYAEVPKENIIIDSFYELNDTINGTYFVWGIRKFSARNCDNEEFETFREKFIRDDKGNEIFKTHMKNYNYGIHKILDWFDPECEDWEFPWWIIILILILLFLLLFLWLLWIFIPRCCAACCSRFCTCCGCCLPFCAICCTRNGKYASLRDTEKGVKGDVAGKPNDTDSGDETSLASSTGKETVDGEVHPPVIPAIIDTKPIPINPSSPTGSDIIGPAPKPRDETDGTNYQVESWTDDRLPNIHTTHTDNQHGDYHTGSKDMYYDQYDGHHTDNRHGLYHGGSKDMYYDQYDGRHHTNYNHHGGQLVPYGGHQKQHEVRYVYEPQQHQRHRSKDTHILYDDNAYYTSGSGGYYDNDGYYINKSDLRKDTYYNKKASTGRHVHVKQPVAVRVKRSELKEYLRQQGRTVDGNEIRLKSKDLEKLMKGDAKFSFLNHQQKQERHRRHKSRPRLADALIDRRIVYTDGPKRHKRSYSTSSLNDFIAIKESGKRVAIKPESVRFRMKGYEDVDYTSSSSGKQRILLPQPHHQKHQRFAIVEPRSSSSSSDERKILIAKPTTNTRRRLIVEPQTSSSESSRLSDIVVLPKKNKSRRKIYEITNKTENRNNNTNNNSYELKKSSYSKTFTNKGYKYDSEC